MTALSNYLENKLLDAVLAGVPFTSPTKVYVALFTSNPGEDGTGTEVTGGNYTRQEIQFNAASAGNSKSKIDVLFPPATANWGTITHVAFYDAATSGNMLFYGPLTTSKSIVTDDQLKLASGDANILLD